MHALTVIKNVCVDAMDDSDPAGMGSFRAVVDPESVYEMARLIEILTDRLEQTGIDQELVDRIKEQIRGGEPAS